MARNNEEPDEGPAFAHPPVAATHPATLAPADAPEPPHPDAPLPYAGPRIGEDPWAPPLGADASNGATRVPAKPASFGRPFPGALDDSAGLSESLEPVILVEDTASGSTEVARRSRNRWTLVGAEGGRYALTATDVVIGRNPTRPFGAIAPQLLAIRDSTRTISKTHARLRQVGADWMVSDLGSTNGTAVVDSTGATIEVEPGESRVVTWRILLGDCELTLERGP